MKFHKEDGTILELKHGVWTDGNFVVFKNFDNWPVDDQHVPLTGELVYPKLKMFNREKGYGFAAEGEESLFIHITGLRIPRPGYDRPWIYSFANKDELNRIRDGLCEGVDILVLKHYKGRKGLVAEEWAPVSLHNEPMDLYVVFHKIEDISETKEEGQDRQKRMWTTTITKKGVVTLQPVMSTTNIMELTPFMRMPNHVVYRCHTQKNTSVFGLTGYSTRFQKFEEVPREEIIENILSNIPQLPI